MSSQEGGGLAATTPARSLPAANTTNKIQAVNPKAAFASPQAEATRKHNKTITANRGAALGDIVMQMSSPLTKSSVATDSKTETKKSLPISRQGQPDREAAGQNLLPNKQLRRLDYVERPTKVVQQGTFEINSARRLDAAKAKEGTQKYNTSPITATGGGRSL